MTRRRATILCEDRAHWHFARACLQARGWNVRQLQPRIAPAGRGAAERWVRDRYPEELRAYRSKAAENACLIVIIDGDKQSPDERVSDLEATAPRGSQDRVALFVPCRNIETWIAYLEGHAVSEEQQYRSFKRGHSRGDAARELASRCAGRGCLDDAPASLVHACDEWRRRLA